MSKEKSHGTKSSCSSSSSSSSDSTRPCGGNKCADTCNGDLCAFGKDAINFNLWIQQLVGTGSWLQNGQDSIGYALKNTKLNFTKQANGKKGVQINITPKVKAVPPIPVTLDGGFSDLDDLYVLMLVDVTDPIQAYVVYDNSQLIVDNTYNVAEYEYDGIDPGFTIALTQLSFVYSGEPEIKLIGNPMNAVSSDEVIAIVAYLNERINCLNVPCCVKERVTGAIMANLNKYLNPQDPDGTVNVLLQDMAKQEFTSFCEDDIIPDCGPIYIANVIINQDQLDELSDYTSNERVINRINSINFIINIIRTAQYYLQTYMSSRCCCSGGCKEGDKHLSAQKACKFVFGRFCVVNVPLPALDFIFKDWENTLD